MSRIWEEKKKSLEARLQDFAKRSDAVMPMVTYDQGDEWRAVVLLDAQTLVQRADGTVATAGPVVLGIRYHERFLSEAPHPLEIVTILQPRVFHPNANAAGAMCLGHPHAGLTLDAILHQVWAGLAFNMKSVNTLPGEILNREAANFVRANACRFPLNRRGLFEPHK